MRISEQKLLLKTPENIGLNKFRDTTTERKQQKVQIGTGAIVKPWPS